MKQSHGFALKIKNLPRNGYSDEEEGEVWRGLEEPCANCAFLLDRLGHKKRKDNFGAKEVRTNIKKRLEAAQGARGGERENS